MMFSTTESESEVRPSLKILQYIAYVVLCVLAGFLAFQKVDSPDIGFYLKIAEWMLNNLSFLRQDVFTYTYYGNDEFDFTWSYELIFYTLNKTLGPKGMVLFNASLVSICWMLVIYRISLNKKAFYSVWSLFLILLGILATGPYEIRPHIFSWAYISLITICLEKFMINFDKKWLYLLPILMVAWTNSHPLYPLGWGIIFAYGVEIYFKHREQRKYLIWMALAIGASFINPYFVYGVIRILVHMMTLVSGEMGELLSTFVSEFRRTFSSRFLSPETWSLTNPIFCFYLFIVITILAYIITFRNRKIRELIILGGFGVAASIAVKNIGYFVMALLPITASALANALNYFPIHLMRKRLLQSLRLLFYLLIIGYSLITILRIRTDDYFISMRSFSRFGYEFNNLVLPVKASDFLITNNLTGRIFNDINSGGFLMYKLPQPIFIDGRYRPMPKPFFKELIKAVESDEGKQYLLHKYNPQIAIFCYYKMPSHTVFFCRHPEWRLVYFDESYVIFLKKEYAPHVPSLDTSILSKKLQSLSYEEVKNLLLSYSSHGFLKRIITKQYYPQEEINKAYFCYLNGWYDAAISILLEGLSKSTTSIPEIFYNLTNIFLNKGEVFLAKICLERYLEYNDDKEARRLLSELELYLHTKKLSELSG